MSSIESFFSHFVIIDRNTPPEIADIQVTDFALQITIRNVSISNSGLQNLRAYFGDTPVMSKQLDGEHGVQIFLSRLKIPEKVYSVFSILKYIQENRNKGLYMGINDFGPLFLSFDDLTHAQLYGASGFGKSSFFRLLLSQALAFHDNVVNYIIDPKQIDYRAFKDHPRVGYIASNRDEWYSLLGSLITEMSVREHIFSEGFSTPPTSLKEYQQFRSELGRDDLPDFPRILLWIDEAHVLNDYHPEDLGNHLGLLLKKGRAFGIHVMATTQRVADMPSTVKSQASTVLFFYMHDATNLSGLSLEDFQKNMTAIKGRISYYNATQSKFFSAQTPFLTPNESLGMAYGFGTTKSYDNNGLYRLKVSEKILSEARLPIYLCRGHNLKSLAALSPLEIEEGLRSKAPYKFLYTHHFDIAKTDAPVSPPLATGKKPAEDLDDDILLEFNALLRGEKIPEKTAKPTPAKEASPTPLAAPAASSLELMRLQRSDNTPDTSSLNKQFQEFYQSSSIDFSWCTRDLSGNQGLLQIYKHFSGEKTFIERPIGYADLAYEELTQSRLDKYVADVKSAVAQGNKAPLLIISGKEGMGKNTLAHALASSLNLPIRKATSEDLLGFDSVREQIHQLFSKDNDPAKKTSSENSQTKLTPPVTEFVVFHDLNSVLTFYRNCSAHQIVIYNNEWKSGLEGMYNKTSRDFLVLKEPHLSVELTSLTYKPQAVLEKLIRTLLKKYSFLGDPTKLQLKAFTSLGMPLIPMYLDALLERAQKKSFLSSTVFDWKILNEALDSYRMQENQERPGVSVVLPVKELKDMVAREETTSDILDIIHKAKTMESPRLEFAKRLRKAERMVALFSGPPGTGKSMAAEVIAKETGKELWICDFGKMQNSLVGETEKILSDIFYQAQTAKAVLLLDEADAFLAHRSGNHASYMLKWINHLLNLIENYSGILILTSNHPENMDPAFSRRIDVKARFYNPDKEQMTELLKKMLLPDAPLSDKLDFDQALQGISLSGGLLRNALERLIVKMERFSFTEITTDLLHSVLNETQIENSQMIEDEKRIGLV